MNRLGKIVGLVHVSGDGTSTFKVQMNHCAEDIRHLTRREFKSVGMVEDSCTGEKTELVFV